MKFYSFSSIILLTVALGFSCVEAMNKNYAFSKFFAPKAKVLAIGSVYGLLGVSAYNLVKEQKDPKLRKLYAKDFPLLGVEYTRHLKDDNNVFKSENVEYIKSTEYYQAKKEKSEARAKAWGEKISQGYVAPLYLAHLNEKIGYGTFAGRNIEAGEFIGSYVGRIATYYDMPDARGAYAWGFPHSLASIDAFKYGNELRFVNHDEKNANVSSCYVLVDNQYHLVYKAKKPILKDEQLFVNYGPVYFRNSEPDETLIDNYRFCSLPDVRNNIQQMIENVS